MTIVAIKIRIMPTSPEVDLEEIKIKAKNKIEELGASLHSTEQEKIAFGLKALICLVAWPEEKSPSELENAMSSLQNVKSIQIIDVRRVG